MKRTSLSHYRIFGLSASLLAGLGLAVTGISTRAEAQGTKSPDTTGQAAATPTAPAAMPAPDAVKLKSSVDALQAGLNRAQNRLDSGNGHRDALKTLQGQLPGADDYKEADRVSQASLDRLAAVTHLLRDNKAKDLQDRLKTDSDAIAKSMAGDGTKEAALQQLRDDADTQITAFDGATADQKKTSADVLAAGKKLVAQADALLPKLHALMESNLADNGVKDFLASDTSKTPVADMVGKVYGYAHAVTKGLQSQLDANGLKGKNASTDADDLRKTLASQLKPLGVNQRLRDSFERNWNDVKTELVLVVKESPKAGDKTVDEDISALQAAVKTNYISQFPGWFQIVGKKLDTQISDLAALTQQVSAEVANRGSGHADQVISAPTRLNETQNILADLRSIQTDWSPVSLLWAQESLPDADQNLPHADAAVSAIGLKSEKLGGANLMLLDILQGDANHFTHDQIRLFYFSDVPRLIKALNESADIFNKDAFRSQDQADALRVKLVQADADVAAQVAAVNDAARKVKLLDEQIRQVNAQAAQAASQAASSQRLLNALNLRSANLGERVTALTTKVNDTKNQPAAGDSDAVKLKKQTQLDAWNADLKNITADKATVETQAMAQQNVVATSQTSQQNAETERAKLLDDQAKLPADRRAALDALSSAQQEAARLRRLNLGLAEQESQAFAEARDNAPFFLARANAASNDPAHRVILYAYPDNKTIFIRGLKADVEYTKELIAEFDRPAPQARITLWTLQMNGASSKTLNDAMANVDRHLRDLRTNISEVQTVLRDCIQAEVKQSAQATWTNVDLEKQDQERLARSNYYAKEVRQTLGLLEVNNLPKVDPATAFLTRWTLPDPTHLTTLGEMIFVLSLGNYDSRKRILDNFYIVLNQRYGVDINTIPTTPLQKFTKALDFHKVERKKEENHKSHKDGKTNEDNNGNAEVGSATTPYPHFPEAVLNSLVGGDHTDELTANQREILTALKTKAHENVSAETRRMLRRIDALSDLPDKADKLHDSPHYNTGISIAFREQYIPMIGYLYANAFNPSRSQSDDQNPWFERGLAALGTDRPTFDHIKSAVKSGTLTAEDAQILHNMDASAYHIAEVARQRNSLANSTPRVAAADDMIKRLIILAEDDLDYFFVTYAMDRIRHEVPKGVQLGVLQRESLLATNRLLARVDPQANADVELAGNTDALQAAQQLGQIASGVLEQQRTQKLANVTPLAAGVVGKFLKANDSQLLGIAGAASLLSTLFSEPRDVGEVYSINSGNRFQVTPIFDPSGQALRFKFDFVGSTRVTEPNGTINRQIPRIERHTVNTEVQLSNLEVREISRFETNATVGTPIQRIGGIPFLKDLPFIGPMIQDIPILGYYVKTGKSASTRQESIIFAQTSIYPTVGDIVDLVNDVPSRVDVDSRDIPTYLKNAFDNRKP